MVNPRIGGINGITGETWEREMTDEEYAVLLETGWTEEPQENIINDN